MNRRERVVLIFLCTCFVVGAGITLFRTHQERKHLQAITVNKQFSQNAVDSTDNEIPDSSNKNILININTASIKEFDVLPGIGPALAQRIIDYRDKYNGFKSKDEILKVSGIGQKKFSALKDKITITQ
jgi:comEA protein